MTRPRVLIVIPCGSERGSWICPALAQNLLKMAADQRFVVETHFLWDAKPFHVARNLSVVKAREINADALVMIDNDQSFPGADPLDVLHEAAPQMAIIGQPSGFRDQESPTGFSFNVRGARARNGGFVQVSHVGTGTITIRREVWERIPGPWFFWECSKNEIGSTAEVTDELGTVRLSEDFYFCQKARAHGFQIWVHQQGSAHFKTTDVTCIAAKLRELTAANKS